MNKRRVIALAMIVALVSGLVASGCPAPAPPAPEVEYEWRFGTPWTQKTRNESIEVFCDLVGVYSDGRIQMEFFPDGLLGSHTEIFRGVQLGDIEIGVFAPYVDIVPGGMLNWMPWTISGFEEADRAYAAPDGILFRVMQDAWNDVGGQLLWCSPFGLYGLGNNVRPLVTPDDLGGSKFRVSASLGFVKTLTNMGSGLTPAFSVTTIPWADLYGALERGVVDGCWSLWPSLVEERHFEVLTYYTDLRFGWDSANVVMTKELWDELPADLRDAIMRAGRVAELRDYWAEQLVSLEYREYLVEAGLEIYYPTPEERDLWREKANMPAVWAELVEPYFEERYPGGEFTSKIILDELAKIRAELAALGVY